MARVSVNGQSDHYLQCVKQNENDEKESLQGAHGKEIKIFFFGQIRELGLIIEHPLPMVLNDVVA